MATTQKPDSRHLARLTPAGLERRIHRFLLDHADTRFAEGQRRFFQHQVKTCGARGGAVKEIARLVYGAVKGWPPASREELMERLWKRGTLEAGAVVCHVQRRMARTFGEREFLLFEQWIDRYVHNWAHADGVASWLLAACLANLPSLLERVEAWTASPNRWKRRAAAVCLLQEAKQGRNTGFLLRVAKRLLPDRDDMVEKGVGWLLKEAYPRRPVEVAGFLLRERCSASRLTLRYAAEKMPADARLKILG